MKPRMFRGSCLTTFVTESVTWHDNWSVMTRTATGWVKFQLFSPLPVLFPCDFSGAACLEADACSCAGPCGRSCLSSLLNLFLCSAVLCLCHARRLVKFAGCRTSLAMRVDAALACARRWRLPADLSNEWAMLGVAQALTKARFC